MNFNCLGNSTDSYTSSLSTSTDSIFSEDLNAQLDEESPQEYSKWAKPVNSTQLDQPIENPQIKDLLIMGHALELIKQSNIKGAFEKVKTMGTHATTQLIVSSSEKKEIPVKEVAYFHVVLSIIGQENYQSNNPNQGQLIGTLTSKYCQTGTLSSEDEILWKEVLNVMMEPHYKLLAVTCGISALIEKDCERAVGFISLLPPTDKTNCINLVKQYVKNSEVIEKLEKI